MNPTYHEAQTQKRFHLLTYRLIEELGLNILRAPRLNEANIQEYETEPVFAFLKINLGDPLNGIELDESFQEMLIRELAILWAALWKEGFAAWGFTLYLQTDNTVMLTDYSRFGFRMTSGVVPILLPQFQQDPESSVHRIKYFFNCSCFPRDFVQRLAAMNCLLPADCLPQ
jgi:hypothetical protein